MPALASGVALALLCALILLVAGEPLSTDDTWLHLALGQAYSTHGPWLQEDPLLAVSLGPPTPAAWLFDAALFTLQRVAGFTGLRVVHALSVAAILALALRALRRASGTWPLACLGTALFAALSAYRLIQLRPHLFTIAAVLLLYGIAFARERALSRRDIALVALLFAVWANVHAAFLLGPILLGAGAAGLAATLPLRAPEDRAGVARRAGSLALGCVVGGLATLLNPAGLRPHLAFFVAGSETPTLGRVADEWAPVDLFSWPPANLPPSPLSWGIEWGLILATTAAVAWSVRALSSRRAVADAPAMASFDPALLALAVVGCALPLVAVRFLWLGILPLLALADGLRRSGLEARAGRARAGWVAAVATLALVPGFAFAGAWPMVRVALPETWFGYSQPYHAGKYHANLVWIMHDARLEGTLFSDYHIAGFAGRHLAPRVRSLVNGTLNVPPDVIDANLPLRLRRGERPGERFVDLLDRHGVDLWMGIRLPRVAIGARPWFHTTAHLERTEGWLPVFRNLNGAVYLRDDARNAANVERIVAYYAEQSVPFDPEVGFDVERVVSEKRAWAIREGIVPTHFDRIAEAAYGSDPALKAQARNQLASLYAVLGLYERALEIDALELAADPGRVATRRRMAWCQLRLGGWAEARETARPLRSASRLDQASRMVAEAAEQAMALEDDEARRSLAATLPLLDAHEASVLMVGIRGPSPRPDL